MGTRRACGELVGAKSLEDLRAFQQARAFKLEVYRLVEASPPAQENRRFRGQLIEAAASGEMNVREGFKRFGAGDMAHFLSYALASLAEAIGWLQDGVDRKYFRADDCAHAFSLGESANRTTTALHQSLQPYIRRRQPQPQAINAKPRLERARGPGPPRDSSDSEQ